jgi:nucleoside-triphosphatase THEP1
MSNIHILSEPIHSGKTTMLMNWCNMQADACGILMPDVDGMRKLYDAKHKTYYDFQVEPSDNEGITHIGKFYFDDTVFLQAKMILLKAAEIKPQWLVLDEVGRLEMNMNGGFEPAVTQLIKLYQKQEGNAKLLLVIRDYLLEESFEHYGLNKDMVLHKSFFL